MFYMKQTAKKSIKKSTPYQARTIVSLDIFFTYGHKTPESLLCRHMHQQYSSYRGHGLAVAISWVVNGVGLQNFVQVFLTIKYHREQILGQFILKTKKYQVNIFMFQFYKHCGDINMSWPCKNKQEKIRWLSMLKHVFVFLFFF